MRTYKEDKNGRVISQAQLDASVASGRFILDGESPQTGDCVFGTLDSEYVIFFDVAWREDGFGPCPVCLLPSHEYGCWPLDT